MASCATRSRSGARTGSCPAADRRRPRLLRRPGPDRSRDGRRAARPTSATRSSSSTTRWSARLRALEMPVVCAVNGVAAGAGASIALACDIVLAARSASFLQAFAKIGLVPDSGGTWPFCRACVGERAPRRSRCSARSSPPSRPRRWGLIWKVVDDDKLHGARPTRLPRHLATQPTRALARIKQAHRTPSPPTALDVQLDLERDLQARARPQPRLPRRRARRSCEKRPPNFTGRMSA